MTTLVHLSIQHCPRGQVPAAPSNEERYRAFREAIPVLFGNTRFSFKGGQADPAAVANDSGMRLRMSAG
ncbi:MAG: hypothetical protein QM601_00385 [Pseudoxanthomonas sp.]